MTQRRLIPRNGAFSQAPNRLFPVLADLEVFGARLFGQVHMERGIRKQRLAHRVDLRTFLERFPIEPADDHHVWTTRRASIRFGAMGGVVVASNEGDHFQVRDVLTSDDDTTSLTSADYDLDGDLDLYVCVDYPNEHFAAIGEESDAIVVQGGAANRVYHDANNAGKNSLYRNEIRDSKRRFVDATVEVGLDENNRRFTWAAAWEDYDNDGDQDLYVANDFGRNCLYQNEGGRFRDIAAEVGVEDSAAGMSADWGDVDRDGRMDIYVANMFSSAGSRITEQPEFKQDVDAEIKQRWRRFAMGNTLFKNDGSAFRDVSSDAAVTLGRWSWSSNFLDVNNDGWPDLAVANGYITTDDTSDL